MLTTSCRVTVIIGARVSIVTVLRCATCTFSTLAGSLKVTKGVADPAFIYELMLTAASCRVADITGAGIAIITAYGGMLAASCGVTGRVNGAGITIIAAYRLTFASPGLANIIDGAGITIITGDSVIKSINFASITFLTATHSALITGASNASSLAGSA